MGQTIREIADELEITKQAVSQRMDAIKGFRDKHTSMIGNRIIVDSDGAKLIKNFEKIGKNSQEHHQERQQEQQDNEFKVLKHQLKIKDHQINELQSELSKQQKLGLSLLKENELLISRISILENNSRKHRSIWRLWR